MTLTLVSRGHYSNRHQLRPTPNALLHDVSIESRGTLWNRRPTGSGSPHTVALLAFYAPPQALESRAFACLDR